ncbi:MAG: hypothetical protein M1822_006729 [Bathelium mastoideum]|nr:MAG: hypothetical protein M1822_006729 [Bathelium mastoideum]
MSRKRTSIRQVDASDASDDEDDEDENSLSASPRRLPSPVRIGGKIGHDRKRRKVEERRPILMLPANEFRYSGIRLDETRLIILHPSESSASPIKCSLIPVPFSQLGEGRFHFEALSYSWGEDEPTNVIYLRDYQFPSADTSPTRGPGRQVIRQSYQDEAIDAPFRIRNNLCSALTRLRLPSKKLHLWIDAVCINQDDDVEKSSQISQMAIIYSKAQNVRIWLGESDSLQCSEDGMQFVDKIVDLNLLDRLVRRHPTDHFSNTKTARSWVAFANVLKRSWFRRRWIVQEVAFAERASVQCGAVEKNWSDFADAVELFIEKLDEIRMFYNATELSVQDPDAFEGAEGFAAKALVAVTGNIFRRPESTYSFERTWSLETLVSKLGSFEVTDPRDAIFALSSMARDNSLQFSSDQSRQLIHALKIDYGKHPLEVYTEFVKYSILSTKSLDIVCRHWAFKVSEDESIVQNWWFKAASAFSRKKSDTNAAKIGISDDNVNTSSGSEIEPYRNGPDFQQLPLGQLTDFLIAIDNMIRQLKQLLPYLGQVEGHPQIEEAAGSSHPVDNPQLYGFVARNLIRLRETVMDTFITKLFQGPDHRLNASREQLVTDVDPEELEKYGPVSFLRATLQSKGPGLSWTIQTSLSLLWGICWVFHNYGYAQNTSASIGGRRAPYTVGRQCEGSQLQTPFPSWIGVLGNSAFGAPHMDSGRENADSLVGEPGQAIYNASEGFEPDVDFGEADSLAVLEKAPVSQLLATAPVPVGLEPSSSIVQYLRTFTPETAGSRMTPNRFDGRLSVKGIKLDRIVWVSSRVTEGVIPGEALKKLGWYPEGDLSNVPDRVWRTLVADRGPDGKRPPGFYRRACLYCLANANSKGDINTEKLIHDQSRPQIMRDFLDRARSVLWNRRVFATENKESILGLAPNSCERGDIACILFGCSVPVVLREHNGHGSSTYYKLVGECYAHGRMDGETFQGMTAEKLSSSAQ